MTTTTCCCPSFLTGTIDDALPCPASPAAAACAAAAVRLLRAAGRRVRPRRAAGLHQSRGAGFDRQELGRRGLYTAGRGRAERRCVLRHLAAAECAGAF